MVGSGPDRIVIHTDSDLSSEVKGRSLQRTLRVVISSAARIVIPSSRTPQAGKLPLLGEGTFRRTSRGAGEPPLGMCVKERCPGLRLWPGRGGISG